MNILKKEFYHIVGTYLNIVSSFHELVERGITNKQNEKNVDKAQKDFCNYLERIINKEFEVSLPENYSTNELKQALKKSEFDWKDAKKYYEFEDWLLHQTEYPRKNF